MNPTGISFRNAADAYPAAKPDDPVSLRIEASLLAAIPGMLRLEKPDPSRPRLFNLCVSETGGGRVCVLICSGPMCVDEDFPPDPPGVVP
jgi:hypothetical protein